MNYVILLAGGVGKRMGADIPKQFIKVKGKPIIVYSIENFQRNEQIEKIVVVCVKDWIDHVKELVKEYGLTKVEWVIEGGSTGHDSIKNGVFFLKDKVNPDDYIIVHDAVRPILPQKAINEVLRVAHEKGNASSSIVCHPPIVYTEDGESGVKDIDREHVMLTASPQVYKFSLALSCYEKAEAENKNNLQIFNNNQNARMSIAQNNAISSSIGGILAMTPASVFRGTFGTMFDVANEGIKQTAESMNYNLNIDNMRNSPQQLQSMNSDAVLISYIDEFGILIEMQEPIDFEKQSIIDYFKIFGYTYNKINKVKQFIKTRKYYNYLQANIFEIDGHIAEQLKDLIKSTLSKGIRFWHKDNFTGEINFDLNNIERSISNG